MNCLYCQMGLPACITSLDTTTNSFYLNCKPCGATFQLQNDKLIYKTIRFYLNDQDPQYKYTEDHLHNRTTIYVAQDIASSKIILRLPFIVKNINPQNVKDKIKTYLTFS